MVTKIFVYGTLRPGGRFFHAIERHVIQMERNITLPGFALWNTGRGYPAVVSDKNGRVIGDLLTVSSLGLEVCDSIEDVVSNLYQRIRVDKRFWLYIAGDVSLKNLIQSGDWVAYQVYDDAAKRITEVF